MLKFTMLPKEHLITILYEKPEEGDTPDSELFIGFYVNHESKKITFLKADFTRIDAPFSIFTPSGTASPDFNKVSLDDYGQTVVLGVYEAASDSILWDVDDVYRNSTRPRPVRLRAAEEDARKLKKIKEMIKAWKDQIFDKVDEIDCDGTASAMIVMSDLALGFFIGCGATIEQAENLCRLADKQGLI